jgi:hypothetical protein
MSSLRSFEMYFCVRICTFVPVKQEFVFDVVLAVLENVGAFLRQNLYFCTSSAFVLLY